MVTASWPIIASTTNRISSGSHRVADVGGLLHQLGVDAEPAGGVDDDDVVLSVRWRARSSAARPSTGSPTPLPGSGAKTVDPGLLADHLQLLHGVGALQVARRPAAARGPAP